MENIPVVLFWAEDLYASFPTKEGVLGIIVTETHESKDVDE